MRKFVSALLFSAVLAFAEYQAFDYTASYKCVEPRRLANGEEATASLSDSLKGILVTVACYPCQADFGKEYPSWLYVVRGKDKAKTLWRIQVSVSGGVFGEKSSADRLYVWDGDLWSARDQYAKQNLKKAWFAMDFSSSDLVFIVEKDICGSRSIPVGILGNGLVGSFISHAGYGTAAWKTNSRLEPEIRFNEYVKSASGNILGKACTSWNSSSDLVNYSTYAAIPVTGTFSVKFNAKMTEKIRGTADWSKIDSIIYAAIAHNGVVEAEGDVELEETDYCLECR